MDTNIKHVVSMLVAEDKMTLFTAVGEVLVMPFDGPHDTTKISKYLTPKITGTQAVEIDLNTYLSLNEALTSEHEEEGVVITTIIDGQEVQGIFYLQKVKVAVGTSDDKVEIPNVEKLSKHTDRAAQEKSPAVRNFLRRLAPVVKERLHSAEDLMSFIERSELPLTNDGRIIGYKRVNRKDNNFVDCHSGNIIQNVGDRVWMEVDAVDPRRDKSCSYGLHVANLDYLRSFSGSHTLIVLINPEDFIAVPYGETNKCRVCSYDVVGVISGYGHDVVNKGEHIEGDITFENLISQTVAGIIPPMRRSIKVGKKEILEIVNLNAVSEGPATKSELISEIVNSTIAVKKPKTKPSGKSLKTDGPKKKKDILKMAKQTKAASSGKNLWDDAPANVIAVFEDMRTGTLSKTGIASAHNTSTRTIGRWADKYDYEGYVASKTTNMTVSERARQLFVDGAYDALAAFKKTKKKSYTALGFTAKEEKTILAALT